VHANNYIALFANEIRGGGGVDIRRMIKESNDCKNKSRAALKNAIVINNFIIAMKESLQLRPLFSFASHFGSVR
jgi:hypothetical protein